MASRMVVFPEPFGPKIPVMPGPNTSSVSACCRKLTSRSRCSSIRRRPPRPPPPPPRLRPAQVELEVERPGLVAADRRVIEIARGGARHVEHELARDLIVDRWLRGRDLGGDTLVELLRGQALAVDRRQLEVPPHRRDAPELDARAARID